MNLTPRQWLIFLWHAFAIERVPEKERFWMKELEDFAHRAVAKKLPELKPTLALIREDISRQSALEVIYQKWQTETGNKMKRGSPKWFKEQTVSTNDLDVWAYLDYSGIKAPHTPDMEETAKQDILMRRTLNELRFKTAAPLRQAYEEASNIRQTLLDTFRDDLAEIRKQIEERRRHL